MAYRKVKITKMMVEHYKMVDGGKQEVVANKVYEDVGDASSAIDTSRRKVELALHPYATTHSFRSDHLTRPTATAGFRKGKAEMHWWQIVPVVQE